MNMYRYYGRLNHSKELIQQEKTVNIVYDYKKLKALYKN